VVVIGEREREREREREGARESGSERESGREREREWELERFGLGSAGGTERLGQRGKQWAFLSPPFMGHLSIASVLLLSLC
jgi:hypothetical protein